MRTQRRKPRAGCRGHGGHSEPFIDTLIICTLTGLVILSSGVWQEKYPTAFSQTDTEIIAGAYSDQDPVHVRQLSAHLDLMPPANDPVRAFSGTLTVQAGVPDLTNVTILHNRSVAENVRGCCPGRTLRRNDGD